jgi:transposase-like protein
MNISYLRATEISEKWSQRSLRGFYKYMDEIREMFKERYPL